MIYDKCPNCGYDFTNDKLHKKITGCYTTKEIIEAMKRICPEARIDEYEQSQYNTLWKK